MTKKQKQCAAGLTAPPLTFERLETLATVAVRKLCEHYLSRKKSLYQFLRDCLNLTLKVKTPVSDD